MNNLIQAAGKLKRYWRVMMIPALLFVFSCRSVGPKSVVRDRNAYLNAVSDSWKGHLLLSSLIEVNDSKSAPIITIPAR